MPNDKMDPITQQGRQVINKVTNAVEKTGKQVAKSVSQLTGGRLEDATEEVIQASVDKALDILEVAGDQVRAKGMDAERESIQVGVSIAGVAQLTLTSNVPADQTGQGAGVALAKSDPEDL
ncbi:MAG: hypothetical protein WA947_18885 [Phormidesmis sp.]